MRMTLPIPGPLLLHRNNERILEASGELRAKVWRQKVEREADVISLPNKLRPQLKSQVWARMTTGARDYIPSTAGSATLPMELGVGSRERSAFTYNFRPHRARRR